MLPSSVIAGILIFIFKFIRRRFLSADADTSGIRAGVYISEAQNMSVNLMKLALQRIGEDSICIIDGDCKTQVDDIQFAGSNNGMKRASKVFRGEDIYGEITLKNIHRSKISRIAERM